MTTTSALRLVEFVSSVVANAAILVFSFKAYRRTRLRVFAIWIASTSLGIILISSWYSRSLSPQQSQPDYATFTVMYRIGFIIDTLLGATGSVMLLRVWLAMLDSPPPKTANAPD